MAKIADARRRGHERCDREGRRACKDDAERTDSLLGCMMQIYHN